MWVVHSNGAAAQRAKGWAVHFQSSHAWIGIGVMGLFTWQWLGGLIALNNPMVPVMQMARSKGTHALLGAMTIYGGLLAVITGLLSLAGRGDNVAEKDVGYKILAVLVTCLGGALGLTFAGAKPGGADNGGALPLKAGYTSLTSPNASGTLEATLMTNGEKAAFSVPAGSRLDIQIGGHSVRLTDGTKAPPPPLPTFLGGADATGAGKIYSWEEIAKHKTADDCWVVLFGKVYDVTTFLPDHPGGTEAPLLLAGTDATEQWLMLHKPELLAKYGTPYLIGTVA